MMTPMNEPPPPVRVLQMMMGMWVSQILAACAQFSVADRMSEGTDASDAIARSSGADEEAMYRLLRGGAAIGLFIEQPSRKFELTPLGECLRSNAAGSLRDLIIAEAAPGHWLPWGKLYDVVKNGRSFAVETLGMDPWTYYAAHPDEALSFARGMGNLSALVSHDVTRVYDASAAQTIVDVGGSQGVLLAGLLRQSETSRGIVFDRPEVVAEARTTMAAFDVAERVEVVGGDFFESVPSGADLYVLKSILHDWPDDRCAAILRTVHAAAPAGAKLLVVEMLVPDEPQPSPVALMDLNMLVMLNGRERTRAEMRELITSAGFTVTRIIETGGTFSLIEAQR
jgi:hypothetical protein